LQAIKAKKMKKRKDPLDQLIKAASSEALGKLIKELALSRPETRRECFEFLKKHVTLTPEESAISEGEALFALWNELEFDLSELDEYGGGDYSVENHVGVLLYDLSEKLLKKEAPQKYRRELLDKILPYIQSGNAGLDDALYAVAYAACYNKEDLRDLAERFEIKKTFEILRNVLKTLAGIGPLTMLGASIVKSAIITNTWGCVPRKWNMDSIITTWQLFTGRLVKRTRPPSRSPRKA